MESSVITPVSKQTSGKEVFRKLHSGAN